MNNKHFILLGIIVLIALSISFVLFTKYKKVNVLIYFTIEEHFPQSYGNNNANPYFVISGKTKQTYNCLMGINSSTEIQDNVIKVTLKGTTDKISVGTPGVACPSAIGPASLFEKLDITEGKYTLELYLEPKTDKYKVVVTPTKIQISKIKSSFSKIRESETIRSVNPIQIPRTIKLSVKINS